MLLATSPGVLDPLFGAIVSTPPTSGAAGTVETTVSPTSGEGTAVALQNVYDTTTDTTDLDIVVAGPIQVGGVNEFGLVRYVNTLASPSPTPTPTPSPTSTDGTVDTNFGTSGVVTTAIGTGASSDNAIAIEPNGDIVVAGTAVVGGKSEFAVARYYSDGTLDPTFGDGGIVTTGFANNAVANGVTIEPNGNIVAVGSSSASALGRAFALAIYNSSGTLVTTTTTNFTIVNSFAKADDVANAVTLLPNGEIIVAGSSDNTFGVAEYTAAGALDTTFGTGGKVNGGGTAEVLGSAAAVAYDPTSGTIIVGGTYYASGPPVVTNQGYELQSYSTSGVLSAAFGTRGIAHNNEYGSYIEVGTSLAIQSDGNILLGGYTDQDATTPTPTSTYFTVGRFIDTTGAPDGSFNGGAQVRTAFSDGSAVATAMVLQPDGGIVLAGSADIGGANGTDFALARYQNNAAFLAPNALTVTNTNDVGPGSLRAAITYANENPVVGGDVSITFKITGPGPGPYQIYPLTPLPALTVPTIINGETETGWSATTPMIELIGANQPGIGALPVTIGLELSGGNSTVEGLDINQFSFAGIQLDSAGVLAGNPNDTSGGDQVDANFLGTDPTGTIAEDGGTVVITDADGPISANTIGGLIASQLNVISGNSGDGIDITAAAGNGNTGNVVEGNYIGTDLTGTLALGNDDGILVEDGASQNTIGGTVAGAGNVLSANTNAGIYLDGSVSLVTQTVIVGNYIGTNAAGTAAVGSQTEGIFGYYAPQTTIGGTTAAARNVVSGSTSEGVGLGAADDSVIEGNYIGTDVTGAHAIANSTGVALIAESGDTIGGTTAAARNVISGNGEGVDLEQGSGNTLEGNYIGTDVTGTSALANVTGVFLSGETGDTIGGTVAAEGNVISGNSLDGLLTSDTGDIIEANLIGTNAAGTSALPNQIGIELSGASNTIGGTVAADANLIAGNSGDGILIDNTYDPATGNVIRRNTIGTVALPNGGDGVDLDDVTDNTIGGTTAGYGNTISGNAQNGVAVLDGGTNDPIEQNSIYGNTALGIDDSISYPTPVLTGLTTNNTVVTGTLTGAPSTQYRLEFFANPTANGQGETYLGFENFTTTNTGSLTFSATLTTAAPAGDYVTATATTTAVNNKNTSEFSGEFLVPATTDLVVTETGSPSTVLLGSTGTFVVTVTNDGPDQADSVSLADTLADTIGGSYTINSAKASQGTVGQSIAGTVKATKNSTTVTGTGTTFTTALAVGDTIVFSGDPTDTAYTIATINSNTSLTLTTSYAATTTAGQTLTVLQAGDGITANFGNLAVNASATLTIVVDPLQTAVTPGTITNAATVSSLATESSPGGPTTATSTLTIQNPGAFNFSAPTYAVLDNALIATITVDRTGGTYGAVTVQYTTGDGTATAGTNYQTTTGILSFATGVSAQSFTIPIIDDLTPDQTTTDQGLTVNLSLFSPEGGATIGTVNPTAVLDLNDVPGSLLFSASSYTVSESGVAIAGTVSTTQNSATVTGSGTAFLTALAVGETVVFSGDPTDTPYVIQSVNSNTSLTLTTNYAAVSAANQTLNLRSATITVSRALGDGGTVTVNYATSNGSALAGTDYTSESGTLTFGPGVTSQSFTVPVLDNPDPTGNVTVNLTLSAPALINYPADPNGVAALGTPSTAVLTIDQNPGTLQFSAPTYTVNESGNEETVTVTRTGGSLGVVTVNYATSDGAAAVPIAGTVGTTNGSNAVTGTGTTFTTALAVGESVVFSGDTSDTPYTIAAITSDTSLTLATNYAGTTAAGQTLSLLDGAVNGTDYTYTAGTLVFGPGVTSQTFNVPVLDNPNPIGNVVANLTLSVPTSGAVLGTQSTAVLDIEQGAGEFQFSQPTYTVPESIAGTVTTNGTTTVTGTGTAFTTALAVGDWLEFSDDTTATPYQIASITSNTSLTLAAPYTGTAGAGQIVLLPQYTVDVTRTYGAENAVAVNYATSAGTAVPNTDYTDASGTLDFPAGITSESFTIPILDNPNPTGNVTVNLTLSNPVNQSNPADPTLVPTLGTQSTAVLTIDEGPGVFEFSQPTYTVSQYGTTADITVSRLYGSAGPVAYGVAGPVTVNYSYSGSGYAGSGTLSFANGVTTQTIAIPLTANLPNDTTGVVNLSLSSPTGGADLGPAQTTAVLNVQNNPGVFNFSEPLFTSPVPTDSTAQYGPSAEITVTRSGDDDGAVSVQYATSDGTATSTGANPEYESTTGILTFPDGVDTESFTVPILRSLVPDGTTTVNLTLSSPVNLSDSSDAPTLGAQSTAVLNIVDGPGALQFGSPTFTGLVGGAPIAGTVGTTEGSTAVTGAGTTFTTALAVGETVIFSGDPSDTPYTIASIPTDTSLTLTQPYAGASATGQTLTGEAATITVTRALGSGGAVTVQYATSDGTATAANGDYLPETGTLDFADGQTSATIVVPIFTPNPLAPNGGDTFGLTLSNPQNPTQPANPPALGAQYTATVTIQDVPGTLQFSQPTYTITKGNTLATFTVTRTAGDSGPISVDYATTGGTAAPGVEYTPETGTLTFADGVTSQTFTVPILNDGLDDGATTVDLALSAPSNGALLGTQSTAVLDINDLPGNLQFSATTYTVTEGDVSAATITVNRTQGAGGTVTINYATGGGTATAGTDYTATSGTLTFADGVDSQTITIPIAAASFTDGSKTVDLTLSSPAGGAALVAPSSAVLTIQAPAGVLQFNQANSTIKETGQSAVLTVTRTAGSGGAVAVNYTTVDDSAKAGTDYTATSGTLTFPDGVTTETITVPILRDPVNQSPDQLAVVLSSPTNGATLGTLSSTTLTIVPVPGTFQLSQSTDTVSKIGGTVTLTVTRTGGDNGTVTVPYSTSDGTAVAGTNYTATSGTLTFGDGVDSQTITVPILDDPTPDDRKTFDVTLGTPVAAGSPAYTAALGTTTTAVVTIQDIPGALQFSTPAYSVTKGGTATITVTRTLGDGNAVTVPYTVSGGTAAANVEYTPVINGTLSFPEGITTATFTVPTINDGLDDGTRTVNLSLGTPADGATLGSPTTAVLSIQDLPGSLQLSASTALVNENAGSIALTVTRSGGDGGAVAVNYAAFSGTTAIAGTVGTTQGSTTVTGTGTAFTTALAVGEPVVFSGDTTDTPYVIQAINSDTSLTLATPYAAVSAANQTLSVQYDAVAGTDYTAGNGTLNFADGQTSATLTIPVLDNPSPDGNVTFGVALTSPAGGATLGTTTTTTVTIQDTIPSPTPGAPQLSAASDTGISDSDGITLDNGTAAAPLLFTVGNVSPANGYVNLYDITNGTPVLIAGPVQAVNGTATLELEGLTPLADGTHVLVANASATLTSPLSAYSAPTSITIQTSLTVVSTTPANGGFVTSLPDNEIVVQFSQPLAGFVNGGSAVNPANPYTLFVIPRGPTGIFSATSGYDGGSVPIPANLVYHTDPGGTSEIDIFPTAPLSTDVYGISISGPFTDLAGNTVSGVFTTFEIRPTTYSNAALQVTGVTTGNGAVTINNNLIAQPDTIAIAFNKPLDILTVNNNTVQLLANGVAQPAAVAFNPSNNTVYLTPTGTLSPGTVYLIQVSPTVSDDLGFPNAGFALGTPYYNSFEVGNTGDSGTTGTAPFTATAFLPGTNTMASPPLGYGAISFSGPVNMTSLGRFSVMLIPRSGALDSTQLLASQSPLNAQLAFNPNTNQMIVVPTQPVADGFYVFSLSSNIQDDNGDSLTIPGGGSTLFSSFLLQTAGTSSTESVESVSQGAVSALTTTAPSQSDAVATTAPASPTVAAATAPAGSGSVGLNPVAQSSTDGKSAPKHAATVRLSLLKRTKAAKKSNHPAGPLGLGL